MLILNNCFVYYFKKVKRLYNSYKVKFLYLLPYLPNFNPIKMWFLVFKAWIKKYFELTKIIDFEAFLYTTIKTNKNNKNIANYFKHTNITIYYSLY